VAGVISDDHDDDHMEVDYDDDANATIPEQKVCSYLFMFTRSYAARNDTSTGIRVRVTVNASLHVIQCQPFTLVL